MQFTQFDNSPYKLYSNYKPSGDQPNAIFDLVCGLNDGLSYQTLLGVTGSGKTYTMANIIAKTGRPAIIMAHNKTLAAQLYSEMREFFPENNIEYFVSYYDYYQPEAYVPSKDLFIEKDSSINEHIEQMRLSATRSLILKKDVIIVATVSAIYGIGNPDEYAKMVLFLEENTKISPKNIISQLIQMQYIRNDFEFNRGSFRVRGELIDVYPAENSNKSLRIHHFDDEIEKLEFFDPLTGKILQKIARYTIFPAGHYVTTRSTVLKACEKIKNELIERIEFFTKNNKLVEANRIEKRTKFDLEMLYEIGHCKGIENYSRHIANFTPGEAPPTLIDYLPENTIMFIDESHVTIPQISAMYKSDASRKQNLVDFGFRLPSARDNRPLKFNEFEHKMPQTIFVSATPAKYEQEHSVKTVEQVVRPTGLLDPEILVKPAKNQVDDLLSEIKLRIEKNEKVLITTLTKKMAEQLTEYYLELGIKIKYLHSDIDTIERVEIIRDLRQGLFDVLVGINLLREGLDIPEVSLVAILDADKEGFLRSHKSLIQTIGRAARSINGFAILYADKITNSMQLAIDETNRRRIKQQKFNIINNIIPKQIVKNVRDIIDGVYHENSTNKKVNVSNIKIKNEKTLLKEINKLEKNMKLAAKNLNFEDAAQIRDKINSLKNLLF